MKRTKAFLVPLLILTFTFSAFAQEVSKREEIALLELHARTNGHEWTHPWDLDQPISTWYGVKVKDGKVVALDLADNNLKGNLPLTVGNLRNLEYLDLSDNELTGRMPRELRKFDNLKYLDLSANMFKGTLPLTVNRLESLAYLDLGKNAFEGELPKSIIELSNLNSLVLADNNFTGGMPTGMENLKKLNKLYLANNNFNDLRGLHQLSQQQLVALDVDIKDLKYIPLDFMAPQEGTAETKFEDDNEE